jgi:hypothetical protein
MVLITPGSWVRVPPAPPKNPQVRAEFEMATGQLRVRVRAYEREKAWAPPYVAAELAGTRQTADQRRRDAALRQAEADASTDPVTRERLREEAKQAASLAEALDARAVELELVDTARAEWYAHTAETRAAAQRADAELSTRQVDAAEEALTAEEWLAAHDATTREEDAHRRVTAEYELTEVDDTAEETAAVARDTSNAPDEAGRTDAVAEAEPAERGDVFDVDATELQAPRDIRQEAAQEERVKEDDAVRVPSAEETAESVRRAQRALAELRQRQVIEERHAADEASRDDDLARWHADDTTTDTRGDDVSAERTAEEAGPALQLSGYDD